MAECKIGKNKVRTSTKNKKMAVSVGIKQTQLFLYKNT
jgi:hypothetical protein